ncbi:Cytochrome c553 [Franzmannia pantelleriensis]|uniref:Cytochrome c553 n=1 Tax=Franzmannia pantelleriensis TaxID=48727 RepID=A0A1G9N1W3_9GAMM|nr:c-type cytochrome [Halomonas pantelleriensis]SDL80512.1 Cytochrome c553 [Halomonas pantelleriensis]
MRLTTRAPWRRALVNWGGAAALGLSIALPATAEDAPAVGLPFEEQVQVCGACHGNDGNSQQAGTPSLAGQPELTIVNQMIYFRERLRQNEVMTPQARGLPDAEIQALAAYYHEQPVAAPEGGPDPELKARGQQLAAQQRCASCHQSDYRGREQMPRLAGQREDYLIAAMIAYRDRTRGGPDTTMIDVMRGIDDDDIDAMAHFFTYLHAEE